MMLSSRLPAYLDAQALAEPVLGEGHIDLSCGNPTLCGLAPTPSMLGPLHYAWDEAYEPQPLGALAGRRALAAALSQMGQACGADDLVLCASTSEAFAFLFKMVAAPGAAVAVGRPGYPLVQHLAELEGLRPLLYDSAFDGRHWRIDFAGIDRALADGARAVVIISPNNPTGARIHPSDVEALARRCNACGVLAIFDEVFAPYGRAPGPAHAFVPLHGFFRAVSLGGLSQAACLPQAKLSWIVLRGAPSFRAEALAGLCWIADAALSVGAPVQAALPAICAAMPAIQDAVRARVEGNARALGALLAGHGSTPGEPVGVPIAAEAGWYSLVQLSPACWRAAPPQLLELSMGRSAEDSNAAAAGPSAGAPSFLGPALAWLEARAKVRLMAAELFDLPMQRCVVASLLLPPEALHAGWTRLCAIARAGG